MTETFAYWVGIDTPPDIDSASFNAFYDKTHVPEVLEFNPGFLRASRYELSTPDARGDFGPRWLAVYEMADENAARTYIERNDGPPDGRPTYTPGLHDFGTQLRWRILWRQIFSIGTRDAEPTAMFAVGMNVPADASQNGLADFNAFYSNIHVPEVMQSGGYAYGARFERYRELLHPAPGCPRFLATYEGDPQPRQAGFKFTDGPPVWEQHDTLWRLVYRLLSSTPAGAR